jgi:hypothetical protein
MKTKKLYPLLGSTFIVTSMLVFGLISGAFGVGADSKEKASGSSTGIESSAIPQGTASESDAETVPTQAPGTISSGAATGATGTPQEGIKVHGHWAIEVRDPDGTVVTRREFDNAFDTVEGPGILRQVFTRVNAFGRWVVVLRATGANLCAAHPQGICLILEPNDPDATAGIFKNLSVTTDAGTNAIILSGSATADATTDITSVSTRIRLCAVTNDPATCAAGAQTVVSGGLTATFVTVPVQATQIVQVTVTLSFS